MTKDLKVYAAGILDREGDWTWQGTVVAQSIKEGKELLKEWKKQHHMVGTSEVAAIGEQRPTQRPKGVSSSMNLA
jgi:hypothetical protein